MKSVKGNLSDSIIASVLFLIAFIWKFLFINQRDICIDEPFTIFHSLDSVKNILLLPTQDEPHPPLFNLILHFWVKIFGIGPYAVRTLPILFNALTVVFIYLTGKKHFNIWAGLIASGLFIFSTYHFFFGGDTRAYSMLSCGAAASLFFLFEILKEPERKRNAIGLFIANFLLVYSHYFGWFLVGMQFTGSLFYFRNKKAIWRIWIVIGATAIAYIPMFSILIKQFFSSSKGTWVTPPAKTEWVNQLRFFMNSGIALRVALILFGVGIVIAVVTKAKPEKWKELLILFLWWIVPYTFMFFISEKIPMFTNRYILFNTIGFYLFIGAAMYSLYRKTKFILPLVAVLILWFSFDKMKTRDFAIREVKKATEFTTLNSTPGSLILVLPQWANLGFTYYYAPELFKQVDDYYHVLNENGIYPIWGYDESVRTLDRHEHNRVIYFQDNIRSHDPENLIFEHLDSLYLHTDSATFEGGFRVDVFDKNTGTKLDEGTNEE